MPPHPIPAPAARRPALSRQPRAAAAALLRAARRGDATTLQLIPAARRRRFRSRPGLPPARTHAAASVAQTSIRPKHRLAGSAKQRTCTAEIFSQPNRGWSP
jgi:hypothetical protein